MKATQVRETLYKQPFEPFLVRLKDGRTFEIRHWNLGLVGESVFIIGIPAPDDPEPIFADRQEWVQLDQVETLEPLAESTPNAAR